MGVLRRLWPGPRLPPGRRKQGAVLVRGLLLSRRAVRLQLQRGLALGHRPGSHLRGPRPRRLVPRLQREAGDVRPRDVSGRALRHDGERQPLVGRGRDGGRPLHRRAPRAPPRAGRAPLPRAHARALRDPGRRLALAASSPPRTTRSSPATTSPRRLGRPRARPASRGAVSLLSYAIANSVGFGMLSGASVRYRFYTRWGVAAADLSRVVLFYTTTFWLGLLTLGGLSLVFSPLPALAASRARAGRAGGVVLLLVTAAYAVVASTRPRPLRLFRLDVGDAGPARHGHPVPPVRARLDARRERVVGAAASRATSASCPSRARSSVAQLAGMASHVPGGLGVFETALVILCKPALPVAGPPARPRRLPGGVLPPPLRARRRHAGGGRALAAAARCRGGGLAVRSRIPGDHAAAAGRPRLPGRRAPAVLRGHAGRPRPPRLARPLRAPRHPRALAFRRAAWPASPSSCSRWASAAAWTPATT